MADDPQQPQFRSFLPPAGTPDWLANEGPGGFALEPGAGLPLEPQQPSLTSGLPPVQVQVQAQAAPDRIDNWETRNYNFGGLRIPGVPPAGPLAGGFQSFQTPEAGVGAISHQLARYFSGATTGQPLTTLRQIVSTWAPPSENPTSQLIQRASRVTGFGPDDQLDFSDPAIRAKLIEATIRNEQGGLLPVSQSVIQQVAANDPASYGGVGGGRRPASPGLVRQVASLDVPVQTNSVPDSHPVASALSAASTPQPFGSGSLGLLLLGGMLRGQRFAPVDYDPFKIYKLGEAQQGVRLTRLGSQQVG